MLLPVIRELERFDVNFEIFALTGARQFFRRHGVVFKSFKDYLDSDNLEAIKWGNILARDLHNDIDPDESIAYLGLSFVNLIDQVGLKEALKLYKKEQRSAFLPIATLEKVLDDINPDLLITTNPPRAERAATIVAKKRGVLTLALSDLFAVSDFFTLESDIIAVLSKKLKKTLGRRELDQK